MGIEDMMHVDYKPDRSQFYGGLGYFGQSLHPSDKFKMLAAKGACSETAYGANMSLNRKLEKAKEWMKSGKKQ
jgi:hypothetical protein